MKQIVAQRNGRAASDMFQSIARDLESVEGILRANLETAQPGVRRLMDHRFDPLPRQTAAARAIAPGRPCLRPGHARPSCPRRRGGDDPHRDFGSRRRAG